VVWRSGSSRPPFAAAEEPCLSIAPNLIVNYELTRTGAAGLDFFTLTPIGGGDALT
jgi:hypothetical protein